MVSRLPARACLAALLLVHGSCVPAAPDAVGPIPSKPATVLLRPEQQTLRLDFDGTDPLSIELKDVRADGVPVNGGGFALVPAPEGGQGLEFPSATEDDEPPGFMILVTGAELPNPGTRDFSFGADVRLDEVSTSETDNGDNVLQRGLASDPSQFKLQVDGRRPSCVIRGSGGSAVVKSEERMGGEWYRIRCDRSGDDVALTVEVLAAPASDAVVTAVSAPSGAVTFDATTPLTMGRKGASGGAITNQPDQFNGALDAVWVSVSRE